MTATTITLAGISMCKELNTLKTTFIALHCIALYGCVIMQSHLQQSLRNKRLKFVYMLKHSYCLEESNNCLPDKRHILHEIFHTAENRESSE